MYETTITTKTTKDSPSNGYIGSGYLPALPGYPAGQTIVKAFPIAARSSTDAGRNAIIGYRDADKFVTINSRNQGGTEFVVTIVYFYQ